MTSQRSCTWVGSLALLLIACSSGSDSPSAPPPSPPPSNDVVEVTVGDSFFDPETITVEPGQTVRWVLRGSLTDHTVTADDDSFDSGFTLTSQNATFEQTFDESDDGATIEYHCDTHLNCCQMQGSVQVAAASGS